MNPQAPPAWPLASALAGIAWPALVANDRAAVLALLWQLEQSQWLSPQALLERQLEQLDRLLRHAFATVPFYRERWRGRYDPSAALTPERFAQLPLLTRGELQQHFDALRSESPPPAHGSVGRARTSGATGAPVEVLKTALSALFWQAITLREHRWHRRDLRGKLAVIRHGAREGEFDNWGAATAGLVATGRCAVLGVHAGVAAQLRWLAEQQPDYLLAYPSILRALAERSIAEGTALAGLREVRSFGEQLDPELRALCRQAWGAKLVDVYSCEEAGYLALQCPEHEHYHVPSESVRVEILDDDGRPCAPGETGRVVVTVLHEFAMPLVRYALGDYAEVGAPCRCGRGLPVLARILGRTRNMLMTAEGERFWPRLGTRRYRDIAPVVQAQLAQKAFDLIEARLVVARPLSAEQEERLRALILPGFPPGMRLHFAYCREIARSAGGKFEDFVSEVNAPSAAENPYSRRAIRFT